MDKNRFIQITPDLQEYINKISVRESKALIKHRIENSENESNKLQSSPDQTQFIALLAKIIQAKKIIEIGTYKGYTTLALAEAIAEDGQIIACEINKQWTNIAEKYWEDAKVNHKIHVKNTYALDTLNELINQGQRESFDFIFIDADKENYCLYYDLSFELIRPSGLIVIDNTLWYGNVIKPEINDKMTEEIRKLNLKLMEDKRVDISLLPLRDGLTIVQKNL